MLVKTTRENTIYPLSSKNLTQSGLPILRKTLAAVCVLAVTLTSSCVAPLPVAKAKPSEELAQKADTYKNPHPVGTYAHFKARKDYLKTSSSYKNYNLLEKTTPDNSRIVVSLSTQRAQLMNGDEVAIDYAVSTGTANFPTPAGEYKVREMIEDKRSNQYGKIYDAEGKVVKSDAEMPQDEELIPEGGKYLGAAMPYWMRLTWSGVGMHVGNVPRYPASHACIRGQSHVMPIIFSKVKLLTPVSIVD